MNDGVTIHLGCRCLKNIGLDRFGEPQHIDPQFHWCMDEAGQGRLNISPTYTCSGKVVVRIFNPYARACTLMMHGSSPILSSMPYEVTTWERRRDLFVRSTTPSRRVFSVMVTSSDVTGPINIGNFRVFSIHQLTELIVKLAGAKSKLGFEPPPSDEPRQRRSDTSEAKSNLKLEPNTQLGGYLEKVISYFDNNFRMGLSTRPSALSSAPVWGSL
jgi:hypothetical protein